MDAAIHLKDVTKRYDGFTLDHITMDIPKGAIVGLVGENGAGKTTLLKAILQMLDIDKGEIAISGRSLAELGSQWKDQAGVILSGVEFASQMHARQLGNCMRSIYKGWQDEVFEKYLRDFQIDEKKLIKDYSKGMKMKLDLAVALSHQAKILIFDEATSGLDPVARDDILDILLEFIQDEEHTALVSSHIISDLEKVADYIAFLHKGKLKFYMNKDELLYRFGVVHCTPEQYENIPERYVEGCRKSRFGCEALIRDRESFQKECPEYTVDSPNIEEIILFYVKGETR